MMQNTFPSDHNPMSDRPLSEARPAQPVPADSPPQGSAEKAAREWVKGRFTLGAEHVHALLHDLARLRERVEQARKLVEEATEQAAWMNSHGGASGEMTTHLTTLNAARAALSTDADKE